MKKDDILIKREKEPLQEIEWHLSPTGKLCNSLFNNVWRYNYLIELFKDAHRILDPQRYDLNVDYFKQKRDEAKPLQTKIYWHNKLIKTFRYALYLESFLSEEEAKFFNIDKDTLIELIKEKKEFYEIDTYRRTLLRKNNN